MLKIITINKDKTYTHDKIDNNDDITLQVSEYPGDDDECVIDFKINWRKKPGKAAGAESTITETTVVAKTIKIGS